MKSAPLLGLLACALAPFVLIACDFIKKKDADDAAASASATVAATTTAATVTAPASTPLVLNPSATPTTPGRPNVQPVRLPDGGLVAPDGGVWPFPSSLVLPSGMPTFPTLPSNIPIPSGIPLPSGLPFPKPP